MKTADMRYRITIQHNQPVKDSDGVTADNWVDYITLWAAIEPIEQIRTREVYETGSYYSDVSTRIRIRYREDIGPSMNVVCGNRSYNIRGVIDVGSMHKEMHLMCREVVAGG